MANFDPFESGAIALDEVPSQPAFDPFAVGAIEEPSSPAFFQTAAEEEGATKGRLRSAGASFMQGGGVGTGQTVSGLARLGDMLAAGYINDAGARQASANPKIASELMAEGRRLYNRTPEERERDIAANPVTKFGQELAAGAKEAFPENPKFKGEFFTSTIPSSAGQMVPTVAAGMVNPVLAAGQYGLSAGQSGAEESITAGDLADADKVFLSYLGLGAISELALGVPANVVRYLRAARAGGVDRAVARETIKRLVAKGAVREAGQESLEQIGQNVVAQQTFDPSRQTMAGVPESAAAGALLGGAVSGVAAATGLAGEALTRRNAAPAFFQSAPTPPIELPTTPEEQNDSQIPPQKPRQAAATQTEVQGASGNVPAAQAPGVIPTAPPVEPEAARQKLWQNMQGREMDIPAYQWLQPASPHLKLVLGANAPSWRDLNFSGVVTANANPDGSYRVKVIPRTPEQVTHSAEPRTATATEQPTNIPVSVVPNAPPPPVNTPGDFLAGVGKGGAEAFRKRTIDEVNAGRPVTFTKPLAIELARKDPTFILRDNPDGSVSVVGIKPPVVETPVLGGAEADLLAQQREQSRRNNEAQAEQMRAELEAMGVTVPEKAAPSASAPVTPAATQLLTEAVRRDNDIYLSFDLTGSVPRAQELTERFKSLGHDVLFTQFDSNVLSTSEGVIKFRGTAVGADGRYSEAAAQKAYQDAFGQSADIRVKSKTQKAIPFAERFGKSLKRYTEREAGIAPAQSRPSTPATPALSAPAESPAVLPPVSPVEKKTAPVRNASTEFDRLIVEYGPELGWSGDYDTLLAGQPSGGSTMAIEGKKRYSKALQSLRLTVASELGISSEDVNSLQGRAKALAALKAHIEGGMEAGVQTDIPEGASTDFLPPETANQSTLELAQPESVDEQSERLASEEASRTTRANRDRAAQQAAVPLTGTAGDLGQGDLLGAPDDLFAPPAPKPKSNLGSPVSKPMTQSAVESAVRQFFGGEIPANVRFVNDPNAPRATVEMTPRQRGQITLNLAKLDSPELVRDTLREELIHAVWDSPEIAAARQTIEALVTEVDRQRQQEEGYDPSETQEEAANEIARRINAEAESANIFLRAWRTIVAAIKKVFGISLNATEAARSIVREAMRNEPTLRGGTRASGPGAYGLWIAPDGSMTPVGMFAHEYVAKNLLTKITGANPDETEGGTFGSRLEKLGYYKATFDRDAGILRVDSLSPLTRKARSSIRDYAIENEIGAEFKEVGAFRAADVIQETPPLRMGAEPLNPSTVIDPATGERVPAAEGGSDIVNIAGQEFNIMGKDRMTPEQKAAAASRAQTYFRNELGLPGEPDNSVGTRRGSTDTNVVFKIQPDGENYDAAGEKLLAHLTEQIQMQHQPGGNPAYVSMLVNAINKNFNTGTLGQVLSRTMLDRLMNISVGESSWRASMLRAITGITEDMVTVARNPMFFLRRTYENMFGGELVRKIMDRIANNFGESFTGEEIERLYNANPKLQELFNKVVDRLKVKPSLKEVIQEIFNTRVDRQDDIVQKFVDTMVNKFSATPDEAARLKAEFGNTFVKSFEAARVKAQAKALATLLTEERKVIGPGTPLWKKLTDLVNSGWFDSTQVVQEYARSKGMIIPTEAEVERIRAWSIKEQSLKEPTLEEIESNDANEAKAAAKVAAVTLETRQDLLRKMNTLWSRWTHPIIRNPRDVLDPVKRYNTAMAANEWLTANLLLKLGFGSRQLIDVGTQMVLHTPTRAAQYAFEQWANDKSAGRDANLLDNLSQAITDAYRTRLKVLGDTLASFKRTLRGRGEQKNVEQLLSSIGVFDRALLKADEMKAEGRPAAARFLHLLALTLRFGRQFAAAADVIQGVPAEAQEMAHQIRTGLREQGKSKAQQDLEFNTILGLLTTARVESLSEARQMLELRGLDTGKTSVQRAAWHILREKIYEMARNAGLTADEWKAQNHYFRNVIGWNEPETQGLGRGKIGGPGGLVALTARAGKEVFAGAGLPAFPFVFGNAMGISLNRKLAYTPLGFWTSLFKGSPWFEGERNIRQRKIEAVIGTTIGSTLFTLAALGLWVVLPRKWPDDEKEKAKWTANGWQPGMVIIPAGDQEMKISTRVGPMSLLSPYLAAGGALRDAFTERAEKQAVLDERAQKLGLTAEKLEGLDASQWLNVVGSAAYNAAMGGRTASGMLGTYTDFGTFSPKKTGAAIVSGLTPGLPGYQEIARMAGANINPKLASFWDLLVPLPTSDANRVNLLGDPMRNENDVERVLQVLSGGSSPLPANSDQFKKNKAYANLFASDFRPPSINPTRGYQFGNELRPMTEPELQRYTTARGKNFATELQGVNVNGLPPEEAKKVVQQAFQRANASALESVGATPTAQARTAGATSAQPSAPSLSSPATRRTPTGRLRASLSRRTRAPSLGRVRSRLGRTRLATMRVPRLRRSRLRASLSRPRRGRFSVRSRMAMVRRPRVSYV